MAFWICLIRKDFPVPADLLFVRQEKGRRQEGRREGGKEGRGGKRRREVGGKEGRRKEGGKEGRKEGGKEGRKEGGKREGGDRKEGRSRARCKKNYPVKNTFLPSSIKSKTFPCSEVNPKFS
jgi:hypothetical protein